MKEVCMLLQKIKEDMNNARKSSDRLKLNLLGTLHADAVKIGKDDGNRESSDFEVVSVIKKFIKNLDETILANLKLPNTNTALLDREKEILEVYLPKQLSKEELT